MRQLRSELVHTMSDSALEILGVDGQQSDYHDKNIDKATHPGFCRLRDNNTFLGTGDTYLCSDQIVRVCEFLCLGFNLISYHPQQGLRLALVGPKSIQVVTWKSHSRANLFNLSSVPPGILLLISTIVGLLNSYISLSNPQPALLPCVATC